MKLKCKKREIRLNQARSRGKDIFAAHWGSLSIIRKNLYNHIVGLYYIDN